MAFLFPDRISLANTPTPIEPLERISESLNCNIWIKRDDLTDSAISGNKIRKLEFTLARAKAMGAKVLITCGGVQSNHCRATAILGAKLGFKVHLILRGEEPKKTTGNLFLDRLSGAEISYFSPRYYNARLDFIISEISEEYQGKRVKPYFIPTGASDATGVWGYVAAAEEISRQKPVGFGYLESDNEEQSIKFDHIVSATGSGGTQAGLTLGANQYMPNAQVTGIAVCDDEAYFQAKVRDDIQKWAELYEQDVDIEGLNISVSDRYIGPGYAKATSEVFECIELLTRREGIVLDPVYTGKAFFGMLSEIEAGRLEGENILFVHTGGIFGLLAQIDDYFSHKK